MKLQGKAIEAFLARPDRKIRAVLVYGPDAGLVRDRADTLARSVVPDLTDAFRVAELSLRAVASATSLLIDEVAAQSLIGGRRLIRLRDGDDSVSAAFTALFAAPALSDSLVVVEAGDLGARSKLRVTFESATIGAAMPCYIEDEATLRRVLTELAAAYGMMLDTDAQDFLATNLVGNRLVARSEIEKLALYVDKPKGRNGVLVSLDEARAAVGDGASQLSLDDPAWAAASGDFPGLDRALVRLFSESTAPVAILRATQRHFQRLHWVQSEVEAGATSDGATSALKPPPFYKMRNTFVSQLRQWSPSQLRQALDRLTDAEIECKRTNMPDETLCARVLFQLSAMARARR
ncbi:MAG: DNA polymerase III subunit delta [Rhodospirillaceae bacterium]